MPSQYNEANRNEKYYIENTVGIIGGNKGKGPHATKRAGPVWRSG